MAELARLFLRLGLVAFGGPAAHIAMMEEEVVSRRRWLSREQFLDLLGATNLIPGPNSTEMAIHIGMVRAGLRGLIVAGLCFILPATAITLGFAWAYVRYQTLPQMSALLFGVKPVVIAIILSAVVRLGRTAVKTPWLALLGLAVFVLGLRGVNEIVLLLGGGAVGIFWSTLRRGPLRTSGLGLLGVMGLIAVVPIAVGAVGGDASGSMVSPSPSLRAIGLYFLKIGSVLFGSGYVLIAFLRGDLVADYRWLTELQLLDAVAIGQLTPGPVSSTATFIGYLLAGGVGAVVATAGIFLPSFLFVLATNPLIPRIRRSATAASFLDAVNVSSIGLMAAVTVELAASALKGWAGWAIGLAAVVGLVKFRLNPAWLVVGGAVAGWGLN
ncbi:MAG: chromate efflux transporter [candidate division NC10 bacterium]|nr:chromate efflux transporter [candidate division NC10 bacterium]